MACNKVIAELACMFSAFFSTSMLTASDVLPCAALVAACTAGVLEIFTVGPSNKMVDVCLSAASL